MVFTPTAVGQRTAQLAIQAPGGPTIPLRGTGTPGPPTAPELTPGSLAFGEQRVGEESSPQTVTLTNRATVPLRLTGASVTGAMAGFRVDSNACTAAVIAAGTSCQMSVTFVPTVPGRHSGVLSLSVEGVATRPSVVLTGTATGPKTPVVPNVIGLSQNDAVRQLQAVDLQPGVVTTAPHPDIALGAVADQRPRPGVTLTAGAAVDLVISTGPPTTTVPNVVGQPQTAAEQLLEGTKLRTGAVTPQADPSEDPGVVLASKPTAGTEVQRGSAVDCRSWSSTAAGARSRTWSVSRWRTRGAVVAALRGSCDAGGECHGAGGQRDPQCAARRVSRSTRVARSTLSSRRGRRRWSRSGAGRGG